ncbi:MAG: type II toxin-antitoxin system HicA family toxin [Micavibrio sp.]|nr:type II toxin-antitoxin system HicA family toxin [Micavibrio sp.]
MAKGYYRDLIKILKKHGCYFARQGKGDHEYWFSPLVGKHVSVDVGGKSKHTANRILKDAGIEEKI